MIEIAALVMAAGRGTRFGVDRYGSKVLAMLDGKPLVRHVVETALASRAAATFVVTGQAADRVDATLADLAVTSVFNRDYASGMAGSVRAGLAALPGRIGGALILLGDMPRVEIATLDALIAAASERPDAVVPVHAGRRGNPVLIGRTMFAAVAGLTGDEGARRLLATSAFAVLECPVDDPGITIDVDTPAGLRDLERMDPTCLD